MNQALIDCLNVFRVAESPGYVEAPAHPTSEESRGVLEKFKESLREATLAVGAARNGVDDRRRRDGEPPLPNDWCLLDDRAAEAVQLILNGSVDPSERP